MRQQKMKKTKYKNRQTQENSHASTMTDKNRKKQQSTRTDTPTENEEKQQENTQQ